MNARMQHLSAIAFSAALVAGLICSSATAFGAPVTPVLTLSAQSLVTSGRVFTGVAETSVTVTLIAQGRPVSDATPVASNGSFAVTSRTLPYGPFALSVIAENASGQTACAPVTVYNLEATPKYWKYVLVDKSDLMLYLVRYGTVIQASPVAIGMPGTPTRTGTFLLGKTQNRSSRSAWGVRRLPLLKRVRQRWRGTGYYIHGTNDPSSIGTWASHGCVRMYNRDILKLSRSAGRTYAVIRR
jgi:lipoprotein-anchoring transpeptidase ErfK/SrfK